MQTTRRCERVRAGSGIAERLRVTHASIRLDEDQLERLADLIAERLRNAPPVPGPLVDARELARLLGVSRSAVYEHARDLGAIRIGGARGRLRFDPAVAMRTEHAGGLEAMGPPDPPNRRRRTSREQAPRRHPFLEPSAVWDSESGLWRDATGYPTRDQCWRSTRSGTHGLVAQGPDDQHGATHLAWEAARREWRKEHRDQGGRPASGQAPRSRRP
jgi:hypothetical protein